jgi:Spy/CpxP family protein refolding chaperone
MPMMNMMGGVMGRATEPAAVGCPGMTAEPIAAGPAPAYERPWISFALAHPKELGLTAEQVTGLTTLRDAFQKDAIRLTQEIRDGEAALAKLYAQTPIDLGAVEAKIKELAVRAGELRLARVKTLDKGFGLLTPEQRQKLFETSRGMGRMMGAFQVPPPPAQP